MIAGEDGGEAVTQNLGFHRIAFEVDSKGVLVGGDQGEHLFADLEDEGDMIEGEVFDGAGLGVKGFEIHWLISGWKGAWAKIILRLSSRNLDSITTICLGPTRDNRTATTAGQNEWPGERLRSWSIVPKMSFEHE